MKDSVMNFAEKSNKRDDVLTSGLLVLSQLKELASNKIGSQFKECVMSHTRLIRVIRVILPLQYIILCFFAYHITLESKLTPNKLQCGRTEASTYADEFNKTVHSVLSTLCLNERYNGRFASVFIALEIPAMIILIIKILSGTQNSIFNGIKEKVSDQLLYGIVAISKAIIILTPYSKIKIATISIPVVGTFVSLLLSPLVFIIRLLVGLITLPVSMLLFYPMKDKIVLDLNSFGMIFESIGKESLLKNHLEAKKEINCYQICEANFDYFWDVVIFALLVCYSIAFWFLHFTQNDGEPLGEYDAKDGVSEGVEFIRVSEDISEDFSYDEISEEKAYTAENFPPDNDVGLSCEIPGEVIADGSDASTELVEKRTANDLLENNDFGVEETVREENSNVETSVINEGRQERKETFDKATYCVLDVVEKEDKECQSINFVEDLNKEYIKPVRFEKYVQTDLKQSDFDSKSLKFSAGETEMINDAGEHSKFSVDNKSLKTPLCVEFRNQKQKKAASYPSVSTIKNKPRPLSERADVEILEENVKFSFSELSIMPPDLTLEERIKQKSLMPEVTVETFLSELGKEHDKHQVYVEKELLSNLLKDIIMTARVTGTTDCDFCPKSKELTRECTCQIHKLIKSLTKESNSGHDNVDGLSLNGNHNEDSGDESFFDGFRL